MLSNKNKKHRTIQHVFKISTIVIICGIIVLLLPKIEGFKYSYQKGMPWKYETLIAPIDFAAQKFRRNHCRNRENTGRTTTHFQLHGRKFRSTDQ